MRLLCIVLGMLLALPAVSQETAPPKKKKKPAASQTETKAHQKPTREQIRRFNELEKKK